MTQARDYFDRASANWSDLYATDRPFRRRYDLLAGLIGREIESLVAATALDIGCGSGVFSAFLAERGWHVHSVDASPEMLRSARQYCLRRLGSASERIRFYEASIEDLDFEPNSFDLALCLSVVEYVDNDQAALQLLANALRPGGRLVISVPNRGGVVRRLERLVAATRSPSDRGYLRVQRHQYNPDELDGALLALGLVKKRYCYWSVGFDRTARPLSVLERRWWAGMYGAVFEKASYDGPQQSPVVR